MRRTSIKAVAGIEAAAADRFAGTRDAVPAEDPVARRGGEGPC